MNNQRSIKLHYLREFLFALHSISLSGEGIEHGLLPESASLEAVSAESGVEADTLEQWRSESLSEAQDLVWMGFARLEAYDDGR